MRWLWVVVVVLALALTSACGTNESVPEEPIGYVAEGGYVAIPDEPLGPATHTFTDTSGNPWSFTDVAAGRIALVYFGYASCPDVCPVTLADIAVALQRLGPEVSDRVDVAMVTTDPKRDTAKSLGRWIDGINPSFTGVRAPIKDVVEAALAYGINVDPPQVTEDAYEVSHGAQLIVLEPGGGMVGYFREVAGVDAYVDQLPTLLEQHG